MSKPSAEYLARLFSTLPPVDRDMLPPLLNPNNGFCVHCKKLLPVASMPVINTGAVIAQEPLCPECRKTFRDQCRIVCCRCKVVVLWVDPGKENTGFEFKRRTSYHITECPVCKPGVESTTVLEKILYYKDNNIPFE